MLIPADKDYGQKGKKTLWIPALNQITLNDQHLVPIRFFAKRAKFYSAFNLFAYQRVELEYAQSEEEFRSLAAHFLDALLRLDIWDDSEMWAIIREYRSRLDQVRAILEQHMEPQLLHMQVTGFWQGLTVLGRNYEEMCREWFLPTHLAQYLSYPDDPE